MNAPRTIRMPDELHKQISERAKVNRRSFNQEVLYLLESAIDGPVGSDLKELDRMN